MARFLIRTIVLFCSPVIAFSSSVIETLADDPALVEPVETR